MRISAMRHWLAGGVVAVAMAGAAVAQDDPKALFLGRYDALRSAMLARDAAAVGKIIAPDYEMTDIQGGTHNAAEVQERMTRMPADPTRKPVTTVLSATVSGETAAVKQQMDMHMTRPMEDGTKAEMDVTVISDDTWVHRGDAWLLQKSVQNDLTVKKDGEVMFHQGG